MKINNRRYIGNKTKLLDFIYDSVQDFGFDNSNVVFDVFAGTGVIANKFAENGYKTIVNDNLYSNVIAYNTFLSGEILNIKMVNNFIDEYNSLNANAIENNYFSNIYGGKYFSNNDAKLIGYIRDDIENKKNSLSYREYCYLLTSLMYATDKIANTVGHFESYLKNTALYDKGLKLDKIEINNQIYPAKIYNEDANVLVKQINCDIAYVDPPYNARQYVNFYHVLENLARWNKPTIFQGCSMKFIRNELKSGYCKHKLAKNLFSNLINDLNCKLIVVSYNNTYNAKSTSSINTISKHDIIEILSEKGKVTIKEIDYKAFNAGKTDINNHKEFLYLCEVYK